MVPTNTECSQSKHVASTSTETVRLIKDGETEGGRGYGGEGRGRDHIPGMEVRGEGEIIYLSLVYTLTTRMTPVKWAARRTF